MQTHVAYGQIEWMLWMEDEASGWADARER